MASDSINSSRLAMDLLHEEAESAFTATGELSEAAIRGAEEAIPEALLNNPEIPDGFSKYITQSFQSPAGPFQVHFYKNSTTGELFYGLDYKAVFNAQVPTYVLPPSGRAP